MVQIEKYPCHDANDAHGRKRYYIEQFNANLNTQTLKTKEREPIDIYAKFGPVGAK